MVYKKIAKVLTGIFLFCLIFTYDVYAQEALTLEQATAMAVKRSKALQQADYDIEKGWEIRDNAADSVPYIPVGATGGDVALAAAYAGLVSADLNIQMANKNKDVEMDAITLSVKNKYLNVLSAQANYDYTKNSLEVANKDWDNNKVSYANGVISKKQLTLANVGNKTSKESLEAAQTSLDKAYQELNSLIGYSTDARYEVQDELIYSPIEVDDVDAAVTRVMGGNPAIWLAEQQVYLAQMQLDLPSSNPYKARRIDVNKSELNVVQSKESMRNALRTSYQTIKELEHNYELCKQALIAAEEENENNKLLYEVGMLAKIDLEKSELKVLKAQLDITKLICQHEGLKEAFYKPWAYK